MADTKPAIEKESAKAAVMVDANTDVEDMDELTQAEIKKMWIDAQAEFERITGRKLGQGRRVAFDQVSVVIQARQREEFESPEEKKDVDGWKKASAIGEKMITCAKFFIGITKKIAPYTVPGPSQPAVDLCCNALVMLLDIPEKIKEFNASIDETFSKVATALDQLQIYGKVEKISKQLAKHLHNLMVGFIKVCAHAINLQHATKMGKFKAQFKNIVAGNDSGLGAAVAAFERIAENFGKIEQSEIYVAGNKTYNLVVGIAANSSRVVELTSKTSEGVKNIQEQIEENSKKKRDTSDREIRLRKIQKKILLADPGKISEANSRDAKALSRALPGTLEWLMKDDSTYIAWRGKKGSAARPLIVTGAQRSGKTTAVAKMVKDLKDYAEHSQQTSVAYHFFPAFVKKVDEDPTPVLTALKQMALQICEQDDTVARALAESLQTADQAESEEAGERASGMKKQIARLWDKELKLGSPQTGATYFLVFDGIESLLERDEEAGKALLEQTFGLEPSAASQSTVKVIISGAGKTFDDYVSKAPGSSKAMVIDVVASNADDMRICIDFELGQRGLFPNPKPGSLAQKARDMLLKDLPNLVHGQYSMLLSSLDKIELKVKDKRAQLQDLRDTLDELQPSDIYEDMISSLQKRLDPEDIKELNELLKWVLYGAQPFTLEELEAALYLHSHTQPLTSLEYRIQEKYPGIFVVDEQSKFIAVREGTMGVLCKSTRALKDAGEDDVPRITATITIKNADFETTQHFLWDLAIKGIREKFAFEPSESVTRIHLRKPDIGANAVDAYLTFVQHAFKYLEAESQEYTKPIGTYIVTYLPYHLGRCLEEAAGIAARMATTVEASDASGASSGKGKDVRQAHDDSVPASGPPDVDARKKPLGKTPTLNCSRDSNIGADLDKANILTDAEKRDVILSLRDLFDDDSSLERHADLFKVFSWNQVQLDDLRQWINEDVVRQFNRSWLSTVTSKSRPFPGFLRVWIEKIGEHWLRSKEWPAYAAWGWAREFYIMDNKLSGLGIDEDKDVEVKIEEVAQWYQKTILKLDDSALDSLWYERLGETVVMLTIRFQDAIILFEKALAMPEYSWTVHKSFVMAYLGVNKLELAVEQARLAEKKCPDNEKDAAKLLVVTLLSLDPAMAENATAMLKEIVQNDPTNVKAWCDLASAYAISRYGKNRDEFLKLAQKLCQSEAKADADTVLVAVLRTTADRFYSTSMLSQMVLGLRNDKQSRQAIFAALEKVWLTDAVGSERDGFAPEGPEWMAEDRENRSKAARNSVGYFLGAVAYHHPELVEEGTPTAVKTWEKVRATGFDTGGSGYQSCTRALAFDFAAQLAKPGADEAEWIEALKKLDFNPSSANTDVPLSKCLRAAFYASRSRKEEAMDVLRDHVKLALNILTDADETNDIIGYCLVAWASLRIGDFSNAMSAFCWLGEADHVTYLRILKKDMDLPQGWKKSAFHKEIKRIRKDVVLKVNERIPDLKKQAARLSEAANICLEMANELPSPEEVDTLGSTASTDDTVEIQSGSSVTKPSNTPESGRQDTEATTVHTLAAKENIDDEKVAKAAASNTSRDKSLKLVYTLVSDWFTNISKSQEIGVSNPHFYGWPHYCSCEWDDCEDNWGFQNDMYICVLCNDCSFCKRHCKELRDPERDEMETFHICRKTHQWLKVPAWGHSMYEAPHRQGLKNKKAMRVLVGGKVPLTEGDDQIYDGAQWKGYEEVDGDVWLESIRETWGIKEDKMEGGQENETAKSNSGEDSDSEADDVEDDDDESKLNDKAMAEDEKIRHFLS